MNRIKRAVWGCALASIVCVILAYIGSITTENKNLWIVYLVLAILLLLGPLMFVIAYHASKKARQSMELNKRELIPPFIIMIGSIIFLLVGDMGYIS